jgi:hypothetical protein
METTISSGGYFFYERDKWRWVDYSDMAAADTPDSEETLPEKLQQIKDDRSKALRAEKDLGDKEHPDAEHVDEARTAVRFSEEKDGVARFDVVTTRLKGFPLGKDDFISGTQDEIADWVRKNDLEVIDADGEQWSEQAESGDS